MEVKFYSSALKHTGGTVSVLIEPDSCPDLQSLISALGTRFGREFAGLLLGGETWLVLVNGKAVSATGGLNTLLTEDDIIEILPIIGAG